MLTRVYLYDEVPAFGCGYRDVVIEHEGRSKVTVLCPRTLAVANVNTQVWAKVMKRSETLVADKKTIKRVAKERMDTIAKTFCVDEKAERALKLKVKGMKSRLARVMAAL